MRSSSSSYAFSCSLKCSFLHILYSSIYNLLLSTATVNGFTVTENGFSQLIELPVPRNGLYSNTSTRWSRTAVLSIDDFGAKGDGFSDDTKSFQDVWKVACSSPSRAKIVIPVDKFYLVRPTDFTGPCRSKVTLSVSGFIVAPRDPEVWDGLNIRKWLYFHQVKHLKIEGGGIIDGMGWEWWSRSCKKNDSNPCTQAPAAVTFHRCKNLKLRNITLFNGQQLHMAFTHCNRVAASHVTVIAPADSPNMDGIHISASTRVELKDIIITTGDDCISVVSNSSRISVKNVVCGPGNGISIGSLGKYNSSASVQDVIVSGAALFDSENGVRIKTWQGGSGFARNITFENIWMRNVSNPIVIDQYYCASPETCGNQTAAVSIDRIYFRNIKGTSATEKAIRFACSDSYPCKRLYLENIQLTTSSGIAAKSFCWKAYGTSTGLVYPPSCILSGEIIIRYRVKSNSTGWRRDDYAVF
ncbi:probable polygalacturonase At1g80170 isoform X2 [Sesamum indicum]|uniref:endo-polygalacturonase n=1 Tax=Sesamum indicum TaxID=4182 RepID=A0A6I9SXA0_SESIN|nr:probable polygalacturonase At1g80170 isoform X2 [Sesamum indicum]